jgi:hypothetical protein
MLPNLLRRFLALGLIACVLSLSPALRADDADLAVLSDVHDLLMKARSESDADAEIADLTQAREALKHANPAGESRRIRRSEKLLKSAIYELQQGDPHNSAVGSIAEVNRLIGF